MLVAIIFCALLVQKPSQAKPSQAKPSQAKPSQAKPSQVILWATDFTKPFNIKDGPRVGEGTEEISIRAIEQELKKKYKLDEWDVPATRSQAFFKSKKNYCSAGMMKTKEREKIVYYSPFLSVSFSHVLISKKGIFDSDKPRSLKKILEENKYIIGIEQSASYGMLDPIIKDGLINHHSSFFLRPGVGSRDALLKMLQSNRVQLYLGNLEETIYFQKMLTIDSKMDQKNNIEIDFHSLTENSVNYNPDYIGCSKSPEGKLIIEDIAKIIRSKEFDRKKKAVDGARKWFDAKTLALFEQYFDEELKKNP